MTQSQGHFVGVPCHLTLHGHAFCYHRYYTFFGQRTTDVQVSATTMGSWEEKQVRNRQKRTSIHCGKRTCLGGGGLVPTSEFGSQNVLILLARLPKVTETSFFLSFSTFFPRFFFLSFLSFSTFFYSFIFPAIYIYYPILSSTLI